jgi:hypothetical protein
VIDLARHSPSPAALEGDPPPGGTRGGYSPALRGDDPAQQPHRVIAVAPRDEPVDPQEQARLIGRGHRRAAPGRVGEEMAHADPARERAQRRQADARVHGVGGAVVGHADHRAQQRAVVRAQRPPAHVAAAQVRDQQHRLDDARRAVLRRAAPAPRSSLGS